VTEDRRKSQRLRLAKPILALMRGHNALILDIGLHGAFVEHYGTIEPGDRFNLSFRWQGEDVEFVCEVARTTVVRAPGGDLTTPVSHSGTRFVDAIGESESHVRDMIATFVGRILAAQKANASGDARDAHVLSQIGEARRTRSRGYVSYRYKSGSWWRVPTDSPTQPLDGFTVPIHEDEEELETLCQSYEAGDEETRNLIRLLAELSTVPTTPRR
jgi:hypothetical protein